MDRSLTQLKDLREFVNGVVSGDSPDCRFPTREFVDIQIGMVQVDAQGERRTVKDLNFGELNVFRIDGDGNWEIMPNIRFSYQ